MKELDELERQRELMPALVPPKGSDLDVMLNSLGGMDNDPRAHSR